jgi:raffinose/stachyose/melibiose transport system permease protein
MASNTAILTPNIVQARRVRRPIRTVLGNWWQYAIALFFAAIFGFPLVWMMYSSLKTSPEILKHIWDLPANPSLQSYLGLFNAAPFGLYYRNSIAMTLVSVPILTITAAMAAYAFARVRFPLRTPIFYLFLAGTMIPIHVTLIPLFELMRNIGLLGNVMAMVLPFVGFSLPVSIFILRGFFEQIPLEIEEAARIDGCSTARIFLSIVVPLARPALTTVIVLSAVGAWNEYLFALTLVSSNSNALTLPLGILNTTSSLGLNKLDQLFAGLTTATLPILVFYFLAQRTITKSLTAGALKG